MYTHLQARAHAHRHTYYITAHLWLFVRTPDNIYKKGFRYFYKKIHFFYSTQHVIVGLQKMRFTILILLVISSRMCVCVFVCLVVFFWLLACLTLPSTNYYMWRRFLYCSFNVSHSFFCSVLPCFAIFFPLLSLVFFFLFQIHLFIPAMILLSTFDPQLHFS